MSVECAAQIYWGEFFSYEDDIENLQINDPESLVIAKETLEKLSSEAKLLLNLIINLPEEMFWKNGALNKTEIKKILREEFKWQWKTIGLAWKELKNLI
jgi:hypothetical protein